MDKSLLTGIAVGVAVATAGGAIAGYKMMDKPQYAEVLNVKPIKETIRTPREECHDEQVTHQRPVKDQNRIAGTALGAVVGGLLGNQVGGGRGKTVATVAGAAAGGYAGNKTQEHMQEGDTYTTTEQRCRTVNDTSEKISGYEVRYRLKGKEDSVRMDHEPGDKIPVKDGQLVLGNEDDSSSQK
ncbi:MAG TPA: glycine zipper 2TM domain-containing protein [Spongiibacteraceae bacterium]|nr:glycine zipper 2TM domain-containing protein [Spongiibacteraceae bacterium]